MLWVLVFLHCSPLSCFPNRSFLVTWRPRNMSLSICFNLVLLLMSDCRGELTSFYSTANSHLRPIFRTRSLTLLTRSFYADSRLPFLFYSSSTETILNTCGLSVRQPTGRSSGQLQWPDRIEEHFVARRHQPWIIYWSARVEGKLVGVKQVRENQRWCELKSRSSVRWPLEGAKD